MRSMRGLGASVIAVMLGAFGASGAWAQGEANFPTKPIRIVIGFPAGGGNDLIVRVVGQKLSEAVGQPVVIENKPGASGIIAAEYVARAAPDGYTILTGPIGSMAINPAVYAKLNYDPQRDFVPISQIAAFPLIAAVSPKQRFGSIADLVAYAKANPRQANYATSAATFLLATELFKQKTGAPFEAINYKGSNESVMAVMTGEVLLAIADPAPIATQIPSGNVRALAVTSAQRIAELPDVPTMAEAGVPDMVVTLWTGFFVPAGTPPAVVKKLEAEVMRIVRLADVRERFKTLAVIPTGTSSEEFARVIASDRARWSAVAKAANIRLEQ
ncbi:MAG: tripartite tricarboxylate transporter substrate binding protein [Proteobacteria bacterium]|nr:tripartite tricarboxylate transporter substrate binding protein [Pseudomonadota bacterium]